MRVRPPITWLGGKSRLALKIIEQFPAHRCYVEPFGGSASVLLAKERAAVEVYNDLDGELANLYRVLRDPSGSRHLQLGCEKTLYARSEFALAQLPTTDHVERARRFLVRQRQSRGGLGEQWSYSISDAQKNMASVVNRWMSGVTR